MKILVTGGSSGLGKALVVEMAGDKDNDILFTYCHHEEISYRLSKEYSNVKGIHVDFTNSDSVDAFTDYLSSERIEVLVNNAYIGNPVGTYFHKTNPDDYMSAFKDNVFPLIKITQSCITGMRRRKFGKIINILTSYLIDVPVWACRRFPAGADEIDSSIKRAVESRRSCKNRWPFSSFKSATKRSRHSSQCRSAHNISS